MTDTKDVGGRPRYPERLIPTMISLTRAQRQRASALGGGKGMAAGVRLLLDGDLAAEVAQLRVRVAELEAVLDQTIEKLKELSK